MQVIKKFFLVFFCFFRICLHLLATLSSFIQFFAGCILLYFLQRHSFVMFEASHVDIDVCWVGVPGGSTERVPRSDRRLPKRLAHHETFHQQVSILAAVLPLLVQLL